MSFVEAGDLASFAAIAESTIANKEGVAETPAAAPEAKPEESQPTEEQSNTNGSGGTGESTGARESQGNVPDEQSQSEEQQRTYANLQPIFLAMEMGQEAATTQQQPSQQQEQQQQQQEQSQEGTNTAAQAESTAAELTQQVQAFVTNAQSQVSTDQGTGSQFVLSQAAQGSGMLLSNMMTTASDGSAPVSLASILQDVVSGMQTSAGTVPAAIITDPTSSTGSFLIVNQNGVPIVRPVVVSNLQGGGTAVSAETLQVLASGVQAVEEGGGHEGVAVEVAGAQAGSTTGELTVGGVEVDIGAVNEEGHPVTVSQDVEMAEEGMPSQGAPLSMAKAVSTPRLPTGKRKLSDGPRVCELCNKAFKYPSDLKKHLQIHTDIKKFKCDDCGRFFRRLHQLNVHTRIHTGEKPYVCNRCGMAFRHDSTLTMHVRTRHDHLRPFKCDECGNTFGRLSHLKKHIKKVCGDNKNKEKPIAQCRFCEVSFPTKGDLRKHLLTCEKKEAKVNAKEVTLHICDTCTKEFASPYNLRRHMLTHTDEKPFQCEVCSRQFKEKSSLTKHLKRKHTGVDQGSQTEESGDQDYAGHVDVIAESAAASGVRMATGEDDTEDEEEGTSTVDATSLVEEGGQPVAESGVTEVVQGSGDVMATVELSTEATALQAAVEALVSASQQQLVAQEDPAAAGKELFADPAAAAAAASLIGTNVVYSAVPQKAELEPEPASAQEIQYVEESAATSAPAADGAAQSEEM